MNNTHLPHLFWLIAVLCLGSSDCRAQNHDNILYLDSKDSIDFFLFRNGVTQETNFTETEKDSLRQIIRHNMFSVKLQKKKLLEIYYFFKYKNRLLAFVQYYIGSHRKFFKEYGRWRPLWISHSSISFFYFDFKANYFLRDLD